MMPQIKRNYPGKSADEIYVKVDEVMERMRAKMGLKYDKDPDAKTGKVSKMGVSGTYLAKDGEVTIDLHFPMLVPGAMKKQVQADIERRLDGLFA
jgi:hypothetical protein